MKCPDIITIDK